MPETVRGRIKNYIEDAIAAERNLEHALHAFGNIGVQEPVQVLLCAAGDKAQTQHQRLIALLEQRGGSPSTAKSALAQMLAFSPLTTPDGHEPGEKNTEHLIVTYAATAAERAMYEVLAESATEAGDTAAALLARQLQLEEADDAKKVWLLLRPSARNAFRETLGAHRSPTEILLAYLEHMIAAEESFETQLTHFSKGGDDAPAQRVLAEHARETHAQYERLAARLEALGGVRSTAESTLAKVFKVAAISVQMGHNSSERVTQNLIMSYSLENAEVAMYEVFATVAAYAGDRKTEQLAIEIQKEEKETAEKVWKMIGPVARRSMQQLSLRKAS